jgi:hypothetical protein
MPADAAELTVVHYFEPFSADRPSIYLVGPTRDTDWHEEAIAHLRRRGFRGQVLVPKPADGDWHEGDDRVENAQTDWQEELLERPNVMVVAWMPRLGPGAMREIGKLQGSGRLVVGTPADAPWAQGLFYTVKRTGSLTATSLDLALDLALEQIA